MRKLKTCDDTQGFIAPKWAKKSNILSKYFCKILLNLWAENAKFIYCIGIYSLKYTLGNF